MFGTHKFDIINLPSQRAGRINLTDYFFGFCQILANYIFGFYTKSTDYFFGFYLKMVNYMFGFCHF